MTYTYRRKNRQKFKIWYIKYGKEMKLTNAEKSLETKVGENRPQ